MLTHAVRRPDVSLTIPSRTTTAPSLIGWARHALGLTSPEIERTLGHRSRDSGPGYRNGGSDSLHDGSRDAV